MTIIPLTDPADPRIADYLNIRERDLVGRRGRVVIEGRVVLETLLSPASRARPLSALIAAHRIEALSDLLARMPEAAPVFAAEQAVMDAVVGFPIHRGILAMADRPADLTPGELLAEGPGLSAEVLARCHTVAIPMYGGFDSLNVATAGAVALSRLRAG